LSQPRWFSPTAIQTQSGPVTALALLLALAALLTAASTACAQEPAVPEDSCAEGQALYQDAKFLEARQALLQCLNDSGPTVEVLLPLAVMAAREGRLSEAEKYSAEAVALAPEDPEARYWHGRALLRLNRPQEARQEWETGLSYSLTHFGILEGLARLSLNQGEPAKAYQLLDQMRRQGLSEAWLFRLMADIAASRGLWAQALGHLKEAMLVEQPTLQDLLVASEVSIMAGDRQGALDFCRRAVALQPGPASYGGLGEAFFATDQMDSALVYLRMAVEQDPANAQHRFNLANALEVTGAVEEADSHFKIFLAAQPDDAVGQFNYGVHLDKMGRSDEALFHVTRAIELEPNMLSARVVRVQLLENVKRWDEALSDIDYLQKVTPEDSAELAAWRRRIIQARDSQLGAVREGKVHILHMVISQQTILDKVLESLEMGADFEELTVRYSAGPAAARGGDIGWIKPADMVEPLRSAIEALGENEISPPIESRGLYHLFKRIP
jgi:tetratricopeptide (TPR) repeat protein